MQEYLLQEKAREQILKTFQLIHDLITPTMGAKGMMAGVDNNWGQPNLTDDGVTVAKALNNLSGWDRVIAKSIIEAAHKTESEAYDGTTLTVLLTYGLYKYGYDMIQSGMHPNVVADHIFNEVDEILFKLLNERIEMTSEMVKDVATIATKIPEMGEIIKEAYDLVGESMDVIVKWDRSTLQTKLEHVKGYSVPSGYTMSQLSSLGGQFRNARLALLKTGLATEVQLGTWFDSIPKDEYQPIVYVILPNFNPESLRRIVKFHRTNNLDMGILFIQSGGVDDIYADLGALSGSVIQDPMHGVKNYLYEDCGIVESIEIERNRTIVEATGNVQERIKYYQDLLKEEKYKGNAMQRVQFETRLGSLQHGVATILIGSPTEAQFTPVKLKLDDAKGAVHKSFEEGVVLGGGRTLQKIAEGTDLSDVFSLPYHVILRNAGVSDSMKLQSYAYGIDVTTGEVVNLKKAGIIDSLASVRQAIVNARSIATSYLRVYLLIKEKESTS